MVDMNGPLASASGRGSVEAARMAAEDFGWSIRGKRIEVIRRTIRTNLTWQLPSLVGGLTSSK